jgi:hypothetical protein
MTRLRQFAVGLIKSKGVRRVAQKMRVLNRNIRVVFDYLKMTRNSCPVSATGGVEQIYRARVRGIIDIKAHVDYISFHRPLHVAFGLSGRSYRFEVAIIDGSPRFG